MIPNKFDKSRIEFTVDLPVDEVQRSDKFFKKYDTPEWWLKELESKSWGTKRKDWYVIERQILSHEWLEIKDRYKGKVFHAQ
jgi:hypothetical protein